MGQLESWGLHVYQNKSYVFGCAGIHRSLGTHISRVKSVDLDTWTDEQLKNMIKWGNKRANKYWEANLSPGHIPPEGKMENFIRTKYDSKRWVLSSKIPEDVSVFDDDEATAPQVARPLKRSSLLASVSNIEGGDLLSSTPPIKAQKSTIAAPQISKSQSPLLDISSSSRTNTPSTIPVLAPAKQSMNQPSRSELKTSILSLYSKASDPQISSHSAVETVHLQSAESPRKKSFGAIDDLAGMFNGLGLAGPNFGPANVSPPPVNHRPVPLTSDLPAQTRTSPTQHKEKLSGFDGLGTHPVKSELTSGVGASFGNAWESTATDNDDFGAFQDVHSNITFTTKSSTAAFGDDGLFSTADIWK